uniref:Uncharacterized protein n=1 Tax=Bryopsis sp. HV04063 TaxID=1979421 RepID=A0A2P0QH69_9CHLO|nr:hypothetical protein [Bryopsis sp. HV04063]ARO74117.1 hypothetical protein [Bryopsis sp. HV04063]
MSVEDYKTCSLVMSICQNMVQQQIITSAQEIGIKSSKTLQNMDAWVEAYIAFPFPFFNFKDMQSNEYKNENFSITTDPDVVDSIINIKDVPDLKKAVIGALHKSGGDVFGKNQQSQYFKYFGIITVYDENTISIRLVKMDTKIVVFFFAY